MGRHHTSAEDADDHWAEFGSDSRPDEMFGEPMTFKEPLTMSEREKLRQRIAEIVEAAIERHAPANSIRHTLNDADAILTLTPTAVEATGGAREAVSPLEIAYGCLWRTFVDDAAVNAARQTLANRIGLEGKQRGVEWAVANLPPVTDAEILEIDV